MQSHSPSGPLLLTDFCAALRAFSMCGPPPARRGGGLAHHFPPTPWKKIKKERGKNSVRVLKKACCFPEFFLNPLPGLLPSRSPGKAPVAIREARHPTNIRRTLMGCVNALIQGCPDNKVRLVRAGVVAPNKWGSTLVYNTPPPPRKLSSDNFDWAGPLHNLPSTPSPTTFRGPALGSWVVEGIRRASLVQGGGGRLSFIKCLASNVFFQRVSRGCPCV